MASIVCPNCSNENPAEMKFCQKCGTSLVAKCRRCGTPNALGAVFCGNCGTILAEATVGIPIDKLDKWRQAFASIGWLEELGPRTKQLLASMEPPFQPSKEDVLFATFGTATRQARNYIKDVRVDNFSFLRDNIGVIATNWRIIFLSLEPPTWFGFPYEVIATIEKPALVGVMKDVTYTFRTKAGHTIIMVVHLDAPGLVGVFAGFGNPVTAGQVLAQKDRALQVIDFLNTYFTSWSLD